MNPPATLLRLGGLLTLTLLGGCAVYVPTIPSTPLVRRGQVEVSAGLRGVTSLEVDAAWAPTQHLLLAAESSFTSSNASGTDTAGTRQEYPGRHRQVALGAGYYRAPTERSPWYLAALAGVGFASTSFYDVSVRLASPFVPIPVAYLGGHLESQYLRGYVQGYAARPLGRTTTGGLSVRGTVVGYTSLMLDGQPFRAVNHGFIEPTLFMRVGHGVLQGQGSIGLSVPTNSERYSSLNDYTAPVSVLIGFAFVFRPDLLGRHQ